MKGGIEAVFPVVLTTSILHYRKRKKSFLLWGTLEKKMIDFCFFVQKGSQQNANSGGQNCAALFGFVIPPNGRLPNDDPHLVAVPESFHRPHQAKRQGSAEAARAREETEGSGKSFSPGKLLKRLVLDLFCLWRFVRPTREKMVVEFFFFFFFCLYSYSLFA